ncbi:uncharacterized protein LOC126628533 isoform X1 [Malus sylvestris]|uniref:uncharacterized protein LOC126628533 isoform X1 n=1 Tax=Malus sylvestris TaxID=3752 RepID=UPI0021AC9B99|nr:uncharacterized protein LOC126628533 isoform X1 [Malus sylvestris]
MMSPRPVPEDGGGSSPHFRSFGCTFSLHLPDPSIHPIYNYAKTLEGQATLKYTDILDDEVQTEQVLGIKEMALPISAGILSALRRVIARRVSLKPFLCFQNQLKRRLNAITIASATCFLFPVAMWDMIIGSPSSTSDKVTHGFLFSKAFNGSWRMHNRYGVVYKMDFSFPGFLICCLILGFGIYEATSLERGRKDYFRTSDPSNGMLGEGPNSDVFTSNLIYVCIWITSCNCELMYISSKFVGSKLLDKCWSISQMLENQNQEEGNILVAKRYANPGLLK